MTRADIMKVLERYSTRLGRERHWIRVEDVEGFVAAVIDLHEQEVSRVLRVLTAEEDGNE